MKIVRTRYILTKNNGTEVAVRNPDASSKKFTFKRIGDIGDWQIVSFGTRPASPKMLAYDITPVSEVYITREG